MTDSASRAPEWDLPDEAATARLARTLANSVAGGMVLYLHGPLGAGKTSFARALLTALGAGERIKSPTYTLLEGYTAGGRAAWHLDLYRIADPGELEWLGLDGLVDDDALVLVEWPERGVGALPPADIELHLDYAGAARHAKMFSRSGRGAQALARVSCADNQGATNRE